MCVNFHYIHLLNPNFTYINYYGYIITTNTDIVHFTDLKDFKFSKGIQITIFSCEILNTYTRHMTNQYSTINFTITITENFKII